LRNYAKRWRARLTLLRFLFRLPVRMIKFTGRRLASDQGDWGFELPRLMTPRYQSSRDGFGIGMWRFFS
jgi:hypothetical protein